MKKEYFGQYGKVSKIVVNTNNAYNPKGSNGPSFSAYVTYSCEREASMAIIVSHLFLKMPASYLSDILIHYWDYFLAGIR